MAEHRDVNLHNSRLELVFEKRIPGLRVSEAVRHHRFIMRSRHVHETIELHFILEGQRLMFVDRETYRLSPHSAIVVTHNLIHKTSTAPGFPPDPGSGASTISVTALTASQRSTTASGG